MVRKHTIFPPNVLHYYAWMLHWSCLICFEMVRTSMLEAH
jgi:hypothetical protein